MNKDIIRKLILSNTPDDIMIGLNLVRDYSYEDLNDLFPTKYKHYEGNSKNIKDEEFEVLYTPPHNFFGFFKFFKTAKDAYIFIGGGYIEIKRSNKGYEIEVENL